MALVRCVQIRRNSSNVITKRRFIAPKSVDINRQGSRGLDNATFVFDPKDTFEEGDELYYIQDNVPVDNLKGIWNFMGSFRDESGYENDDFKGTPYAFPVGSSILDVTAGKFRGLHKMNVFAETGSNVGVRIPNINSTSGQPIIDFENDFDIYFQFRSVSQIGNTPTIFDKYDVGTGQGVRISVNISAGTISVLMGNGTTTTTQTTPAITGFDLDADPLIRVGRQGDQVYIWYDNVLQDTDTYAGDLSTTDDLYLFTTAAPAAEFNGRMYQLRIYDRYLDIIHAEKIFFAKPQSMTMKFGGKVWKIEDKGSDKKVVCNGFGGILLNTQVTSDLFTGTTVFTNGSERVRNVFKPDPTNSSNRIIFKNVLDEIMGVLETYADEYVINFSTGISPQRAFIAEGLVIDIIRVLFLLSSNEYTFNVSPRKVIVMDQVRETNNIITTSNFRLLNDGKDSTNTINDVTLIGRPQTITIAQTSGLGSVSLVSTGFSSEYKPKGLEFWEAYPISIISVTSDDGGGTTYTSALSESDTGDRYIYDSGTNRFKFRKASGSVTAAFTLTFTYRYESEGQANSLIHTNRDQPSIDVDGIFSAKKQLPQITAGVDLGIMKANLLADKKTIKRRVRAESRALVNSLIEGSDVRVFYAERGIGSQDPITFVITPLIMTVRSINYKYPQTLTTIELGEFMFDSFDLETQSTESVRQIGSNAVDSSV